MLEFIFFHEVPLNLFVAFLKEKDFKPVVQQAEETFTVAIPEEMDDELYDAIEEKYDVLFAMNEALDDSDVHIASITVTLQDGRLSYADVDPKVLGRIIGVVSSDELSDVVKAIVGAVENPQEKTSCQRQAEL